MTLLWLENVHSYVFVRRLFPVKLQAGSRAPTLAVLLFVNLCLFLCICLRVFQCNNDTLSRAALLSPPVAVYYLSSIASPSFFFPTFFFLFRLKCLQAQEESRHRPPEHRSSEKRGSERRRVEPRGVDRCGADRCGTAQRKAEEICDYEKQLRTLKDEIAVLSAEKSVLQGRSDQFSRIFSLKLLLLSSRLKAWFGRGVWGVWRGG